MPLKGHAFLALWNDIARDHEPEYDRWHTREHVPERVSVSGIHCGRRYVNRKRDSHRYFTLYDVEDLNVFENTEYVDLLEHPTPWSTAMRPHFSNFVRATCAARRSEGFGIGAAIGLLAIGRAAADDDALDRAVTSTMKLPEVTAVHWGIGRGGLPTVPWTATPATTCVAREFDSVLVVEAIDRAGAEIALAALRDMLDVHALPRDFGSDVYDLAFVFPGTDATERVSHRRPGWDRK